jgi:hypothetical protein
MATTTTNFGWDIPQSTDLVKDGATAIAALGQDIDTALVDLKGGTTGQVLAKASNTDLDYSWVAQDDSNAIQNAIVNAKGDIIGASANDVPAITSVGGNGSMLLADSTTSTGLRWQGDRSGAKNALINSTFDISQRGATITGIAADNTYTADRWYVARGGTIDYAQKTVAGGNNPPESFDAYAQYINQSAANPFMTLSQTLETKDSIRFAGTAAATLSFYARATANTTKSKSLTAAIGYNTTADTKINTLVGSTAFTISFGTAATDWTYCTLTVGIPSTAKTVGAYFSQSPAGGLAVGDGFEVTGVQLERSAVGTAFQRNAGTLQGELAACQRYYLDTRNGTDQPFSGYSNSTDYLLANVRYPVTMRTTPSVTIGQSSGANYVRRISTNAQIAITVTSYPGTNPGGFSAVYAVAAPFVAAVGYDFYILASAEL